ncbi:MAG: hypothetical protein NZM04_00825 [Methylacidiphilales bacterium]|nr:hypothetical protein [Candidatus Methylacidiphilales bacterium]
MAASVMSITSIIFSLLAIAPCSIIFRLIAKFDVKPRPLLTLIGIILTILICIIAVISMAMAFIDYIVLSHIVICIASINPLACFLNFYYLEVDYKNNDIRVKTPMFLFLLLSVIVVLIVYRIFYQRELTMREYYYVGGLSISMIAAYLLLIILKRILKIGGLSLFSINQLKRKMNVGEKILLLIAYSTFIFCFSYSGAVGELLRRGRIF